MSRTVLSAPMTCRSRLQLCGCETIVHMADDGENQPPKHEEAQSQPPANEPPVAQPRQADDEPKVEAEEPRPKAAESQSKPESRFSVYTALISAFAALLGVLVGGIASYMVAQSNNTAQADAELVKSRLTNYADFLTAEIDMLDSGYKLLAYLQDPSRDIYATGDAYREFKANNEKEVHGDYIISLIDSPATDRARSAMGTQNDALAKLADTL